MCRFISTQHDCVLGYTDQEAKPACHARDTNGGGSSRMAGYPGNTIFSTFLKMDSRDPQDAPRRRLIRL